MIKLLITVLGSALLLSANSLFIGMSIQQLNAFSYQDQFEKKVTIPEGTKTVILSFEKDTGAMVNEFLTAKGKDYLSRHHAVFIADIHRMPSLITSMFALPKMQKYAHTIFLNYSEAFEEAFPPQEEKITILRFNEGSYLSKISYVTTPEALQKAIEE